MKNQNKPPPNLDALRQKAEALLKNEQAGSELTFADTLKLIHELEVYQIELELQNKELLFANEQAEIAKMKAEESAEKYAELYDFAPSGYFTLSNNGEIVAINLCGSQMLGKERAVLIKSHLNFFVSEKTQTDFTHFLEKVFAGKTTEACDVILNTKGQLPKFVHLTGIAYKNDEHCLVNAVDITAHKLSVDRLRESEQKLVSILDDVSDVVWSLSLPDMKVNFISPSVEKVFGRPVKEFAENTALWSEIVHPDDKHISDKAFEQLAKEGSAVRECRIIRPDGSIVWINDKSKIICDKTGTPIRFDGVSRDITTLKQKETFKELSREILLLFNEPGSLKEIIQRVLNTMKTSIGFDAVGIRMKAGDDFPYLVQEGFTKEFILTENSLIGRNAIGGICFDKDGKPSLECTCGMVISGNSQTKNPLFTAGGSFWTNDSLSLLDLPAGEDPRLNPRNHCIHCGYASVALVPIINNEQNIGLIQFNDRHKGRFTNEMIEHLEEIAINIGLALMRKKAEIALMESEENFRLIFENNSAAIAIIEPDTTISKVNDAYCQIGGFTKEEIIGKSWLEQIPPEDLERLKEYNRRRLIDPKDAPNKYEFSYYKKNAETGHAIVSVAMLKNRKIIASFFDITERMKAEKDLYNSNELLSSFMNHSPIFAFIKEVTPIESRVLKASENYIDMIGIPGSEMVGKTMFELFPAELAAKITADDWRVVSEGKLLNLEEELNGRIYSSIKFPILQGDKYLLAGYSMDVTVERQSEKALRESEEKQRLSSIYSRSLIEASIDPLVTINADGKITDVNSATENATGISRKDMIGTDFSDYFTEPDKAKIVYQEVFEQGKVVDYPITIRHSSNKLIDVLYNASVYHNDQGNILGVFASARDITVVKKIQEEIKLKNEELEKLNTEKDKFYSIISHDLRSPFQALLGFSSMNPDELLSLPLEKIQKIALAMRTSADKLYNLLDNLLEWSQLQRGTISFKPYRIRLGEVIKEIVTIIRDAADKKMIVINWDIPADLTVMADEQMFESLMRNLVFNAVKFTHKGGSITISAKQVEGNQVRISVQDNGIGMNQQMIDDIFTLDVKTTRPGTEGEPSTGLGLILCKEFIEKHGGKIWVESEEGKGSTFSFSLPARQE